MRTVPAECEFQDRTEYQASVPCHKKPTRAASANGLSPFFVCDDHGRRFRNKWRDHLDDVRVDPI